VAERWRKKPVVIEAVQLRWDTWSEMCEHAGVGRFDEGKPQGCWVAADGSYSLDPPLTGDVPSVFTDHRIGLIIPTLEGDMLAVENDWVIKGVQNELYPVKPDIFAATYEPALT
jgi:hypothetical protein